MSKNSRIFKSKVKMSLRNQARYKNITKLNIVKDIINSIGIHTDFGFKANEYWPLLAELHNVTNRIFTEFEPEEN
jgi:hypothetical protein